MELMDPTDVPLQPRPAGCQIPLTATQLRCWNEFVEQGRLSDMRVSRASVRAVGSLNIGILRESIEGVVRRHESLRTRIVTVDRTLRQQIDVASDFNLEVVDLGVSPVNVEREAGCVAEGFISEKIDLSVGPLFAAKLLRLSDDEHVLVLAVDHIVSDAVSCEILSRDIWTSYNHAAGGRPLSLPQLPVQFADYAVWLHQTYDIWLKKHEAYWRGRLTGAPRVQLPFDGGLSETEGPTWTLLDLPFGKTLSNALRDLARRERTLLSLVVLAVYVAVMSRWCSQRDLLLALVSHGRHYRPELQGMIGFLASFLHFRVEITKESSFVDLLKQVYLEFYSAYQHQDFDRVPSFMPECTTDAVFNWVPITWSRQSGRAKSATDDEIRIQPFPIRLLSRQVNSSTKLSAAFSDAAGGIVMTVGFRSDLFALATIERFADNLRRFAEEFAQRPLTAVASMDIE